MENRHREMPQDAINPVMCELSGTGKGGTSRGRSERRADGLES